MGAAVFNEPVYHQELIDGRETSKPLPKRLHVWIQMYLIVTLARLLPDLYEPLPELNILTGGRTPDGRREYVIPDISVVERSSKYEEGDLAQPPVWAVEILSPGQTIGDLFIRADRLLRLGCPVVWVIWPEKRKAWEYAAGDLREKTGELSGRLPTTAAPGSNSVDVSLTEMWAKLDGALRPDDPPNFD